jgi:hypothetical protein
MEVLQIREALQDRKDLRRANPNSLLASGVWVGPSSGYPVQRERTPDRTANLQGSEGVVDKGEEY